MRPATPLHFFCDFRVDIVLVFIAFGLLGPTTAPAQTPPHLWSHRFGSTSYDAGTAVAVDASGNLLLTGRFRGIVDFGGGNLVAEGGDDIFIAKYNLAGVHQWSQRFGSTSVDAGTAMTVDGSGNLLLTGYFRGTVDFGGGNLVSAGGSDVFVAKYNAAGAHQWSKRFGGTGGEIAYAVDVDGTGGVLVTGLFSGTVNFGGVNLMSAGFNDIFVAKYDAAGTHQWSHGFGSPGGDVGYAVDVDGSGNALVTGQFQGTVNFGGGNLESAGQNDIFVAKYDPAGVHQWSQRFGGTLGDIGYDVAVDGWGNALVTGYFQGTVDFGGGDLTSAGGFDIFVAKFNSAGVHRWSQRFGSTSGDFGNAVAADGSGNVLVTGVFRGTTTFGGGGLTSAGNDDIFVAMYAPEPAQPVIASIVDVGNDQGRQVRIRVIRSGLDNPLMGTPIDEYEAYRRAGAVAFSVPGAGQRSFEDPSLVDSGWDYVTSLAAHGLDEYQFIAPTLADSTIAEGQHFSTFLIRAVTTDRYVFYDSPPDSGYSIDNLAPGIPTGFAYNAGQLSWNESNAEDFDYFSVYGGNSDSFAAATLIDYTVDPAIDVSATPYTRYFVTATDFAGNEGKPAVIDAATGIGGTPTSYVLSVSAYPNPFNPSTTIRYTLPSKGRVTIDVYDARGAHIATLLDEERDAGAFTVRWEGQSAVGEPASSGVYFARVTHASGTKSYKMVLLK